MATMVQAALIYVWPNSTTKFFFGPICRKGVWNFGFMPDWSFS